MRLPLFHQESETGHMAGGMALQEGSLDMGPVHDPTRCAPRKVRPPHAQKRYTRVAVATLFLVVSTHHTQEKGRVNCTFRQWNAVKKPQTQHRSPLL